MAMPDGRKYTAFSTHDDTLSNVTPALSTMEAVHVPCVKGTPIAVKMLYVGFDDGTNWGSADAVTYMRMQHDLIVNQHLDMGQTHVREEIMSVAWNESLLPHPGARNSLVVVPMRDLAGPVRKSGENPQSRAAANQ